MPMLWETTLAAFNSKQAPVEITTRDKIAGAKAERWIKSGNMSVENGYFDPKDASTQTYLTDGTGLGNPDVWWAMNFYDGTANNGDGGPRHFKINVHIDYDKWGNDPNGVLSKFNHQAELILDPIMPDVSTDVAPDSKAKLPISTRGNDTIDPQSLLAGAKAIEDTTKWLSTQAEAFRKWAEQIDGPGDSWEGDAAGEFKKLLERFAVELDDLRNQLIGANYGPSLEYAAYGIGVVIKAVRTAQTVWYSTGFPYQCIQEVLWEEMHKAPMYWTAESTWKYDTSSLGDPRNDAFYAALDQKAKERWLKKVADYLDKPGDDAMAALGSAYDPLITKLGFDLMPVGITLPPKEMPDPNDPNNPKNPDAPPPPGLGDGSGGDGGAGGGAGGGDKNNHIPPPPIIGGDGAGGSGGGGGGGKGNKNTHIPPPPIIGGDGAGGNGGGLGAGTPIRDKDGNVLLDKDKKPILLPPGGYISGGKVYDSSGKEVLGKDGKPIVVPPGANVPAGTGGGVYGPNAKVPKGSTIREDGTVVDPNGKEILDANGNPIVVEKGSSIADDGTLLDPQKKPISDYIQRSRDLQHAWASVGGSGSGSGSGGGGTITWGDISGARPPSTGGGTPWTLNLGSGGSGLDQSDGFGAVGTYPGMFSGVGGGAYEGLGTSGGGQAPRILNTSSGVGPRVAENGGPPPAAKVAGAGAAAAEKATMSQKASALAAEEAAAMRGRSVNTSGGGMPMVPPMGGGMGGGQGEKGRQRTTWLAEDEEVWGTDTGAVSGVIGR
ncbi:hypothetical protein ACFV6D_03570 [Kitasatospora sp. NPDC059812]|uniref:WXG100 family type VII secretion target n=1 Tax=Kitasatospora sp. NPDC059812 TaxID=3346958 RepID=UPI0036462A57